ncbi:oligodendrocyte-myelin glycoprotein [Oncorhynchus keta]|uniref:oligodendrocyte-myelin glycoprotein n=1 Tax=Oncorhynchus keta TaxID=8018 RepID=UPI00227CB153|nr:oligodendrocyte-myelin glycoprotein [Oncorhynchus keta]
MLWCLYGLLLVLCVSPLACLVTSPCPEGCCCPHPGLLVLCESLGLRSFPVSVPLNTSVLSVARNQLCNVDHLLRPFSSLQELSLSHNQLAHFPRGLPPSLETLQLQKNCITYITTGALRQLGNLTRLDLEDNRIRAIQPGALLGLGRLQVLTLKGNRLTSLPLNLPASLTHLDLSANCISALDLPSLNALVNLQVLKINSNCLRSVPESAFDGLPSLHSVELANNLWVCECDILYLYRWLLNGRLKMATDLVCAEPTHLAHHMLLTLSVMAICPRVLKPNEKVSHLSFTTKPERQLGTSTVKTLVPGFLYSPIKTRDFGSISGSSKQELKGTFHNAESPTQAPYQDQDTALFQLLSDHYTLQDLSYEDCLSLNSTPSVAPPKEPSTTSLPIEEPRCLDNSTGRYPPGNSIAVEATSSTNKASSLPVPTPRTLTQQGSSAVISLLAVLCVLVGLLIVAVLLILKRILAHNQRVAPFQQS